MEDCRVIDISDDVSVVRRLGKENEDVVTIISSGADEASADANENSGV